MRTLEAAPAEAPARPDPALPGLPEALSAENLGARLAECLNGAGGAPFDPREGRLFYVRYKPGTSLLVGFHFRRGEMEFGAPGGGALPLAIEGLPGSELLGYARLLPAARFEAAAVAARRIAARRRGARLLVAPEAQILFHLFPFDRALIGLRTAARRGPLKRWAAAHLPWPEAGGRVRGKESPVTLERYKPERRAVFSAELQWEDATGSRRQRQPVWIKSYAPGEGSRTWSVMRRLAETPPAGFHLAAPLAWRAEERLLIQSRLAGVPLLAAAEPATHGAAIGAALHRLQRAVAGSALDASAATSPRSALEALAALPWQLERLGAAAVAPLAEKLLQRLRENRPAPVAATLTHGDFHPHQVLVDGSHLAAVDFDEAGLGDPRFDAGNFVAHLDLGSIRDAADAAAEKPLRQLAAHFLDGYAAAGGPVRDLAWFRALGLARLALVPFRNLRPGWIGLAQRLLARALEVQG